MGKWENGKMGKWENGKMGNGKWEERVTLRWICNPAAMLAIFCFRIANPKERILPDQLNKGVFK